MNGARLRTVLVWISGGALLVAMIVDTLAMFGRALQLPLIGSIEIVQAVVLLAASGALIVATLESAHARVNLLLDRLSSRWRRRLEKLHAIAAALLYAALLAGSVWIAWDLWGGHEESEILRIPYRPLRVAAILSLGTLVVLALLRLRGRDSR
ncbi:MAG: TRAP transporter small permease subunit [Gammaproteobacteria bacterium]